MRPKSQRFNIKHQRIKTNASSEVIYLYGFHTVEAALKNQERQNIKLFVSPNMQRRLAESDIEVNVPVEVMQTKALAKLVSRDAVHQGIILETRPLPVKNIENLSNTNLILVLDQITDPHNVGAIMRSAVAMEVDAIVTTSRYSPAESSVLAKSASGALDMISNVQVQNLTKFLENMGNQGFQCIALDSDAKTNFDDLEVSSKVILVLGSEGKGVRQGVRKTCDVEAKLAISGNIRSLNVSNAAAVSLYLLRQKIGGVSV